ncbi:hypothetical protein QR680_008014 [Steinernema hermaphroditum]|uniref:C-type lectin domain-containing protein n=1 Tax=Steinernema hermaphroditum TaxID=289476 RepID=A0AA39IH67_9BILA|nr:hypothetical protein QR680_008014 [Steinernema hermaphroditum]
MRLFSLVLILLHGGGGIRYSKIPVDVYYEEPMWLWPEEDFNLKADCALAAYQNNRIAFVMAWDEVLALNHCYSIVTVSGFESKSGSVDVYLLDLREKNGQCDDQLDVRELISGNCNLNPEMCKQLESLENHCKEKANNPTCTVVCPEGEKYLLGTINCCHPQREFINEQGDGECCPENTLPMKHDNGTEACYPEGTKEQRSKKKKTEKIFAARTNLCTWKPSRRASRRTVKAIPKNNRIKASGLKKLCTGIGTLPVKIENEEQNEALQALDNDKKYNALIGLTMPAGVPWKKENFRWLNDNSAPTYTNWNVGFPKYDGNYMRLEKSSYAIFSANTSTWEDYGDNSNWTYIPWIICTVDVQYPV